ncbi:MAG TPA: hypothetical protein VG245_03275, partial [Candidatus Dormibacteraeota bacterium]|nr:hypothetical protein [Candidatus Dormibacteraeota bacterium]
MAEAPDGAAPGLLTRAQVLALSGCSEAELARCEEFGIVSADAGGFRGLELLKLQLLRQVSAHAGGFDHLLRRYQEGGYSLNWIRLCLPQTMDVTGVTVGQALEEVGVPLEEVAQVARAAGL